MSDTPASAPSHKLIEMGADFFERAPAGQEGLASVLALVRAAQAAADALLHRDSLSFRELADALAEAEISALRLMAEETQIASC